MGLLDSLKKLFGGKGDDQAAASAEEQGVTDAPAEEAPAEAPKEDTQDSGM